MGKAPQKKGGFWWQKGPEEKLGRKLEGREGRTGKNEDLAF